MSSRGRVRLLSVRNNPTSRGAWHRWSRWAEVPNDRTRRLPITISELAIAFYGFQLVVSSRPHPAVIAHGILCQQRSLNAQRREVQQFSRPGSRYRFQRWLSGMTEASAKFRVLDTQYSRRMIWRIWMYHNWLSSHHGLTVTQQLTGSKRIAKPPWRQNLVDIVDGYAHPSAIRYIAVCDVLDVEVCQGLGESGSRVLDI
jgi:hypothetical protein